MESQKKIILKQLKEHSTLKEKILIHLFKDYTYKVYIKGIKNGFDWHC